MLVNTRSIDTNKFLLDKFLLSAKIYHPNEDSVSTDQLINQSVYHMIDQYSRKTS